MVDAEIWDARYQEKERIFSGNVNGVLVDEAAGMAPGQALDLGCGEGADAIWLAGRGWWVTALDISRVAVERAREVVAEEAPELAGRIAWVRADLAENSPPVDSFDLVSAQYLPLKRGHGDAQVRGVLASVAVGGVLLFVGHDPRDVPADHGFDPADYYLAGDVKRFLGEDWRIEVDELRERADPGPPGAHHVHDVVLRARRLR